MKSNKTLYLVPVMFCFFAMGFVDLVGTATNFLQKDYALAGHPLDDAVANVFPSMVFFWFLLFSVPTGMLMNRIGRKKTVLLSLTVTVVSLFLPLLGENFYLMLTAFCLLGIGNALMQTSLNPLISVMIKGQNLASTLTFGQFIKAIASFLATVIAPLGFRMAIPTFGYGWRVLFLIYFVIGLLSTLLLLTTPIDEDKVEGEASSFADCFRLLGKPVVLLSFIGIMCHVGIDVGTNTTAQRLLIERLPELNGDMAAAAIGTTIYFIFRTVGCLTGSFFLRVMNNRSFFIASVVMMALSMVGMFFGTSKAVLYVAIALVGYGNSNIFSIVFSQALTAIPDKQNEVSGLMIMGLFGGTVFPLIMGFASDAVGQAGAVAVMAIGVVYLFTYIKNVKH